ncbi:MAG: FAD-dependent thymidylate synthase [Chloroflexi bacterium]|nr:FAD-dependent thymidylate synthase [Chloroflexota bacterium]MDA1228053.1 FAD-dependent thymidylate synthase [Chloroflexota bacterium]
MSTFLNGPKIYLVSKPSVDWDQVAQFLEDEGVPPIPDSIRAGEDESAAIAEISARMCYMSYGKGRKDIADFINNLLASKDGSVFEHINYGFVFTGVSRSLTHELVRHRAGFAFSQRSQRYVDESESRFVIPPALVNGNGGSEHSKTVLYSALEKASQAYNELVEALEEALPRENFTSGTDHRKAIRQAARSVLPNATETKIFVTANVRAWRHFIEMRSTPYADWEIRNVAITVLEILQKEAPLLFGDFTFDTLPDGTRIATPEFSKV